MKKTTGIIVLLGGLFVLGLMASSLTLAQERQAAPPEYKELVAASQIKDAAARLKEFERIKAAYPQSQFMAGIDERILSARIELAISLDAVLALQKDFLAKSQGPGRLQGPIVVADQLMSHPKLKTFNGKDVLAAILKYKEDAVKAAEDPGSYQGIPQARQAGFKSQVLNGFEILSAQAYLNASDTAKAMTSLEGFKKNGGAAGGAYYYTLAGVYEKTNRAKEAFEAYLGAAVERYEDAKERAREIYVKLHGKPDGFEAALEARLKALPYEPEPFKAPAGWKGKAVLAELFTGSECPPCVGADLGFDGLIESTPAKYLAILEYHLPIPRPDPMMNPATKMRQEYYGINSTPTVVIDGNKDATGGGTRGMAEGKFKQYKAEIDARLASDPGVNLKVRAKRTGDTVKVEYEFDKAVPGAEYQVVLVQGEEKYQGSNGLEFHKLVVRDIVTVDTAAARQTAFDLAASEQKADQYLTDFENTSPRFRGFKFSERRSKIDRAKLGIVFFAQDKDTKKVLNAVVGEVE
jgi:hypothetical protein